MKKCCTEPFDIELYRSWLSHVRTEYGRRDAAASILTIAGIAHSENAWSDIYAFFLDSTRPHGLKTVFADCLANIILTKTGKKIDLSGANIKREQSTNGGNRIDILIQNASHSVIIENKVFHKLNNDLDDYWFSVKGSEDEKTGIVLTLTALPTGNRNYINVTHTEWLNEVRATLSQKTFEINSQAEILLNDFMATVEYVSGYHDDTAMQFYLNNREKINNLYNIAQGTKAWLQSVFTNRNFIEKLGDFTLVHNDRDGSKYRYAMYRFADTDELVITVFFEYLWNSMPGDARLYLFLEPVGKWFKKAYHFQTEIMDIATAAGAPSIDNYDSFWHCACVEIKIHEGDILNESALRNQIIYHLYDDSPLMIAARKIISLLSEEHKPTYRWSDVIEYFKERLPENDSNNATFWCISKEFILFDGDNKIVLFEVPDNWARSILEHEYHNIIHSGIERVYGPGARFSIICNNMVS